MTAVAGSAREYPTLPHGTADDWLVRQLVLDLHDGATQYVCAALMQVEVLTRMIERDAGSAAQLRPAAGRLQWLLERAAGEMRGLIGAVSPPEISGCELPALLAVLVDQHQALTATPVRLEVADELPEPPPAVRLTLYRVLQEALSNAHRHSGASWISVKLGGINAAGRRELWMSIEDDGYGFEPESVAGTGHVGLAGMRARMQALGGQLSIWSALGAGTMIRVWLEVP